MASFDKILDSELLHEHQGDEIEGGNIGGVVPIDTIYFNTLFADGHAEGRLQWNSEDGTLEYGLAGNTVNLQIGQEEVVKVKNADTGTITNGTVVTFVGSSGGRPKAYRCIANDPIYGHPCGVATEDIASNGYVTTHGLVRDFDTSSLSVGIVYVSGTGGYTNVRPSPPNEPYCVGLCLVSGVDNGLIYVNPQNIKYYTELDARYVNETDFTDANLQFSDITTNNVTTLKHGFVPKLPGSATQFFNGQGNYVTISGTGTPSGYTATTFSGQTSINVLHSFGVQPLVQVLISGAVAVPYSITHNTVNDFTVTFSTSQSGTILASAGIPVPNVTTTAISYSVTTSDNIVQASAKNITITLPTATGVTGKLYTIDNASTGNIFVTGTGGQLVQGMTTNIIPANSSVVFYSTGSAWRAS